MRRLSDTLSHLTALRTAARGASAQPVEPSRLAPLGPFGSNPGGLGAWSFAPSSLKPDGALVVVLHGCTQTAAGYDAGSGWSRLAEDHGFALLYPEQARANNANLCFNWFEPQDIARQGGEAESIRQMVDRMTQLHYLDPSRVFVTGLSAGGAMACAMLAAYPEVFAGGAIVAGLPYGAALGVQQALERMRGVGLPDGTALAEAARRASGSEGPWPSVQVWHGAADAVVRPANGEAILEQWRILHGLAAAPDERESIGEHLRRVWRDSDGRAVLEHYAIQGLGHGLPLATAGAEALGAVRPFMLEAGLSSTRRIAASWGIAVGSGKRGEAPLLRQSPPTVEPAPDRRFAGVGQTIENALRAAGLMR